MLLFVICYFFSSADTPSQWEIEETVRFKDLYDQDKDGQLNREEQLRWVAPNSYGSAREEVKQLLCICMLFRFMRMSSINCHVSSAVTHFPCLSLMSWPGSSPPERNGPRWWRSDFRDWSVEKSRNIHTQWSDRLWQTATFISWWIITKVNIVYCSLICFYRGVIFRFPLLIASAYGQVSHHKLFTLHKCCGLWLCIIIIVPSGPL